jgi:23S rRNA pseudouridine1911/1915/1917 synthase
MSDTTRIITGNQYLVTHSVGPKSPGLRIDQFLMLHYTRRSRSQIRRMIESGYISVIRKSPQSQPLGKMKASLALQPGDLVQVLSVRKAEPAVNFDYQKLFEDEHILVLNKPANIPVHPAGRFFFHTLLTHLQTDGFNPEQKLQKEFYLVHRIDKETSGILLMAKTKEACANLTAQFAARQTEKYYLAIVRVLDERKPVPSVFDIDQPINRNRQSKIGLRMYAMSEMDGGLPSLTHFEKVDQRTGAMGSFALVACFPRTGRQHQIRIHAEIAGYPLVGDKFYGLPEADCLKILDAKKDLIDESDESVPDSIDDLLPVESDEAQSSSDSDLTEIEKRLILPRHALHAAGLRFFHPITQEKMTFESDLPDDLKTFYESINQQALKPFRTKHW